MPQTRLPYRAQTVRSHSSLTVHHCKLLLWTAAAPSVVQLHVTSRDLMSLDLRSPSWIALACANAVFAAHGNDETIPAHGVREVLSQQHGKHKDDWVRRADTGTVQKRKAGADRKSRQQGIPKRPNDIDFYWRWRGWLGSNQRPLASEANTLSTELQPRGRGTTSERRIQTFRDAVHGQLPCCSRIFNYSLQTLGL